MSTLIIIDQPPYGSWEGREALDMAFALAAFDQPVTLLFCAAGVNWLRKEQEAGQLQQKSVERNLAAAPVFGVKAVLVDSRACREYGVVTAELPSHISVADFGPALIDRYQYVTFAG